MKKLIYSLIALAGLFTLASCQPDKLIDGGAYGDGTVNATFSVVLGPQTKAIADGTTVDKLYAGVYEVSGTDYTWVADNSSAPVAISAMSGTVTFNGKLELGKSYVMVFWAMKEGAPYAIDWAKSATTGPTPTTGPTVTVTATGAANDEVRDAFFGVYETGTVTGSIDLTGSPITLKRPFAQVNVLVPTANFVDATAAITSSMSVAQAPTVLNLITKETSDPADWTLSAAAIDEAAFGSYSSTHKYVAMNYVLVDQTAADPRYNIEFSVTCGSQSVADKALANIPFKPNGRTNVVGNIFDSNFDLTVPVIVDPGTGTEQELTTVTVTVGQNAASAVALTFDATNPATTSIEVAVSHPVEVEADKPQITVDPASVATAEWNLSTGKLDVTPLVANGNAVITLVFPAVTKTDYSSATVQVYVKVGNGINATATSLSIDQDELTVKKGNTAVFVVTASEGVGTLGIDPMDNDYFTISAPVQNGLNHTYTVTAKAVTTSAVTVTASGTASSEAYSDPEPATIQISVVDKDVIAQSVSFGETKSKEVIIGTNCELGVYNGLPVPTATLAPNSSLVYSLDNGTTENAFTLTAAGALTINARGKAEIVATAPQVETQDNIYSTASDTYTLTVKERLTNPNTQASVNGNSIVLTWTKDPNADHYEIQYLLASESATDPSHTISNISKDAGTYTMESLAPDTYRLQVVAVAPENSFYANSSDLDLIEKTISAPVQPDFTTIAGLKARLGAESATFTGTLTDAVVSFVAGTRDAVIKDATGSILYHKESGHGLLQGQTISGDVIVDAVLYNGINEITDLAATVEGEESAVEPQVVTLAQLAADYATYESAYVKVVGVTSKTTTTAKGNISVTQDATDYIVYTNEAIPVNTGDIFTAEGTVTKYNTTEELKVWKTADLTVTTAAPVLSATPATKTVNADVTSVTWNITSNTDWTITPGAGVTPSTTSGNGNAEVTLSFAANESSDAATYTATVSADGCPDVTITITQNGAGEVTPISVSVTPATVTSNTSYGSYEDANWIMTCGSGNGSFGCNSKNADTKMKLGDNYVVATPLDSSIDADATHYAAMISKNKLDAGITRIVLGGTKGTGMTVGVTVSTDGSNWTELVPFGTTTDITFSAQDSVYYAVVIKANNKSNATWTSFSATFTNSTE